MTTRFGFYIFAGVMLGAILGQVLYYAPGYGIIFGALAGFVAAGLLEYLDYRKRKAGRN